MGGFAGRQAVRLGCCWLTLALASAGAAEPAAAPEAASWGTCPTFAAAAEGLPTAGEWRTDPALGDVDGDGHLDLAAHPRKLRTGPKVWRGDGHGGWKDASMGLAVPGLSCGMGLDLADVNGDGLLDLGLAEHCAGLFVFLGSKDGLWRPAPGRLPLVRGGFQDVRFGDLDGDGKTDVVGIGADRGGITVLAGDGNGRFRRRSSEATGLPGRGYGWDVELADLDGDGDLDLASSLVLESPDRIGNQMSEFVYRNDGSGRLEGDSRGLPVADQFWGVALGDVNADGRLDIALAGRDSRTGGPLRVFVRDEGGEWRAAGAGLPGPESDLHLRDVEFGDLDGDGDLDLAGVGVRGEGLLVWLGRGDGTWQACEETGLNAGRVGMPGYGLRLGDVNGDGSLDIAAGFGRSGRGAVEVWVQRHKKPPGGDSGVVSQR